MIMMLDCSQKYFNEAKELIAGRSVQLGQLRTPLTKYKAIPDVPIGIDNGCFSGKLRKESWKRIISEHKEDENLKFVCMPDVVGDARRTLELFYYFQHRCGEIPTALVSQDGLEDMTIPWGQIDAIFVGGTNAFKDGKESMAIAKTAKILGKWVHVGRVNSAERIKHWMGVADSFDGSGIAKYRHMLVSAISVLSGETNHDAGLQYELEL